MMRPGKILNDEYSGQCVVICKACEGYFCETFSSLIYWMSSPRLRWPSAVVYSWKHNAYNRGWQTHSSHGQNRDSTMDTQDFFEGQPSWFSSIHGSTCARLGQWWEARQVEFWPRAGWHEVDGTQHQQHRSSLHYTLPRQMPSPNFGRIAKQ